MSASRSRRLRVTAAFALALLALLGALVLAHTPRGRPLLARLDARGGCPVGVGAPDVSPAQLDAQRAAAWAPLRGIGAAPSRPARGLALDRSTPEEVTAWARERGASCVAELGGAALRCERSSLGDLLARFDAARHLVGLDLARHEAGPEAASTRFEELRGDLARDLGPPSSAWGEATAAYLAEGPLRQAGARFRFADFAADVSVTNLPAGGVVLREQYRALPRAAEGG